MVRNVSYNNKEVFNEINQLVGKPFSFRQRLRLGGTGSQRLLISRSSSSINTLLKLDTNLDYCNIELRSGGIIVRFRSILETYAWVIPYNKLTITRSAGVYSLNDGELFVDVEPAYNSKFHAGFFRKLLNIKTRGAEHITSII